MKQKGQVRLDGKRQRLRTSFHFKHRVTHHLNRGSLLLQLGSPLPSLSPSLPLLLLSLSLSLSELEPLFPLSLPSRVLLPKPARGGHWSARLYPPPSPLHFSQHGYSCNLDHIHRRISAVRGTRKVSDRLHRCRCSCCIQCVRIYVCVCVCVRTFFSAAAAAAAIVRVYFSVDKAGEGLSKKKTGKGRRATWATISCRQVHVSTAEDCI